MNKYRNQGNGIHWTVRSGNAGITNFDIDNLLIYEEAIKQYGDKTLFVGKPLKPLGIGNPSYLALYSKTRKDLSDFWRVFEKIETSKNSKNRFLSELKALLNKYDATIEVGFDDCSDTHGMTGEHMAVNIGKDTHKICNHWEIEACDIKLEEK